jgi:hypothetical protein
LTDIQKSTILYDVLPLYYIKKTKEANTEPFKIPINALFQFSLNIEEASVDPGKDSEGNARSSKDMKTESAVPRNQGGRKGKTNQKRN